MKRVGIVTIHDSPNYGGSLQAYALYKYIKDKGAECEIIDIRRPVHNDYIYERHYSSYRNNPFSFRKKLKNTIKKLIGRKTNISQYTSDMAERRFREFNSTIRYSKPYCRLSALKKNPPVYDVYISGSDQLWNPTQPYCLEPYFLTFAPKGKVKISYATSVGITELQAKEKKDFKKWLSTYDAISVREKQAQKLLRSFVNKEISVVLDPTFLLDIDYWKSIANFPEVNGGYILIFLLSKNPEIVNYGIKLSEESKKKLIFIKAPHLPLNENYIVDNNCGPKEFLGYIGNADLVITDSFHCTVFSILMEAKNFATYISPTSKKGSRITDLIDLLGLSDHLLATDYTSTYSDLEKTIINKELLRKKIISEQTKSRNFLDKWII